MEAIAKTNGISVEALLGSCPIPITNYKEITLAHGSGGKLTHTLIKKMLQPQFSNEFLDPLHDGAVLSINGSRLAFSTDSYVVNPIFFPGGNIGELAINGTVNDLSMCGAQPLYLSAGFIIEEGFSMHEFWEIILSMQKAARKAGVFLVTGDTKVVDKGKADKIYINTSGIGLISPGIDIRSSSLKQGDKIIINGPIAAHGIAIMSVRENLEFETTIKSDTVALNDLVQTMIQSGADIHMLRDATRGGISSVMNEMVESSELGIYLEELAIPIQEEVRGACEILGLDPLYVANEGILVAIVAAKDAENLLQVMKGHELGRESAFIGEVSNDQPGMVMMKSAIGGQRIVDMLSGEQLPRIC